MSTQGPGSPDPAAPPRPPKLLADNTVLVRENPPLVIIVIRRRIFDFGYYGLVLLGGLWAALALNMFWGRLLTSDFPLLMLPSAILTLTGLSYLLRRITFEVDPFHVKVIRSGLFGRRSREWKEAELEDIRIEKTTQVNKDVPLYELVFELTTGKKVRMLRGDYTGALDAVAGQLVKALWIPRPEQDGST